MANKAVTNKLYYSLYFKDTGGIRTFQIGDDLRPSLLALPADKMPDSDFYFWGGTYSPPKVDVLQDTDGKYYATWNDATSQKMEKAYFPDNTATLLANMKNNTTIDSSTEFFNLGALVFNLQSVYDTCILKSKNYCDSKNCIVNPYDDCK